jgi:hypothetical protein
MAWVPVRATRCGILGEPINRCETLGHEKDRSNEEANPQYLSSIVLRDNGKKE